MFEKKLKPVQQTLDGQTLILDAIAKQLTILSTEKLATDERLRRYERFMKIVADKLGIDVRNFD